MTDVDDVTSYKIGRGEVKYEVFQIIESSKIKQLSDAETKEIMQLRMSLLEDIEREIQKL